MTEEKDHQQLYFSIFLLLDLPLSAIIYLNDCYFHCSS